MQLQTTSSEQLMDVVLRIRELRDIMGYSTEEMAELTGVSHEQYLEYEKGAADLPFTFLHNCAKAFGVELIQHVQVSVKYFWNMGQMYGKDFKISDFTTTMAEQKCTGIAASVALLF